MSEFSDSITEGFLELYEIAGAVWVVAATRYEFRTIQGNDAGSFDMMSGGTDFKRSVTLQCIKSDFPNGVPAKKAIVYRKAATNVHYVVKEDTSTENEADPTFTLKLELKIG